ncbi:MAG TPA: DinB family protein [Trueperaceae bacterium]|nr:DinB family protein [Trueperaceae bacterium]
MAATQTHPWLRGPVKDVAAGLQPVAHALMQTIEEATAGVAGLPDDRLWRRPAGLASVGFHLKHIAGVVDRLFTYARGDALSPEQRQALAQESREPDVPMTVTQLLDALTRRLEGAIEELKTLGASDLQAERLVGSKKLPSTVQGLLFHAAEHSQRHVGQLLVTAKVVAED